MGCWHTKHDINDRHPNIFKVMNVDEQGQLVSPGQLELTETEMVLYQKGKTSTKWPLAYIRRYGFESELFSFECGRRCPTGPGIYAFRCRRAELLFNLLQERIAFQRTVQDDITPALTNTHGPTDFPVPLVTTGPAVPIRPLSQPGDSTESVTRHIITRTQSTGFQATRLNSISSNGPLSPSGAITPPLITSPEPPTPSAEHNNNKRVSLTLVDHSYSNTILPETDIAATTASVILPNTTIAQFVNTEPVPVSPSPSIISETCSQFNADIGNSHLYMNVTPGDISPVVTLAPNCNLPISYPKLIAESPPYNINTNELPPKVTLPLLEEEDQRHCYANLETEEIEGLRNRLRPIELIPNTNTATTNNSTSVTTREVVYAILDLDKTKEEIQNNYLTIPPPESPKKLAKGYTIIDFNKTEAVSQIAKPKQDCEGSRKTRHNSTISELSQNATTSTRHSSSLSD